MAVRIRPARRPRPDPRGGAVRTEEAGAEELFDASAGYRYHYRKGFNPKALQAFLPAAGVAASAALVPYFGAITPYAWFIGTALAAGLYAVLCRAERDEALAAERAGVRTACGSSSPTATPPGR
ncbi:hypothetical protein ACIOEX_22800 [Streptomyces sp. NPDC087850]|uniref:hypothetical protein n=1 Tax=Streptomyces sp. NPDC087850 TaxID=3365809 RepID=UPI0038170D39